MAIWDTSMRTGRRLGDTDARSLGWPVALLLVAILYLAVLVVYRNTALSLFEIWMSSNLYGHGPLVLPTAIFLMWLRRRRLAALAAHCSLTGVALVALSALIWLAGEAASINLLRHLGLVAMLPALFAAILGARIARANIFPLAYLLFAVPVGGELIPILQEFTGVAVATILVLTGVPAFLEANFLVIPDGRFEIAEACAGARFLIASVAVAVFGSDILFRSAYKRVLFIAGAVAIAIIGNALRAYLIVVVADWRGLEAGIAFDHVTFGLAFLGVILALLFALGLLFRDRDAIEACTPRRAKLRHGQLQPMRRKTAGVAAGALLFGLAPNVFLYASEPSEAPAAAVVRPAINSDVWRPATAAAPEWHPVIAGADAELTQTYTSSAGAIDLHVTYFAFQRQGGEAVNEAHRYAGAPPWRETARTQAAFTLAGQTLRLPCATITDGAAQRLACHFFWVDGVATGTAATAKWRQLLEPFRLASQPAAVIGFSMLADPDGTIDLQLAEDLFGALSPIAAWFGYDAPIR